MKHLITHPDKILYLEGSITKEDIAAYYQEIYQWILPYVSDRLLTLVRCPENYKKCFFQKHIKEKISGLHKLKITEKDGNTAEYVYLNDLSGLLSLVQLDILEIHAWQSHIQQLEHPDQIVFDLDPAAKVPWEKTVIAAFQIKKVLHNIGLKSFIKTTGGKGLHVVVPIKPKYDWATIKNFALAIVNHLVTENPKDYIGSISKSKRTNKIFIDYLRNQRGATAIVPYSIRAKKNAPVAVPLEWSELTNRFEDTFFTLKTLPSRLAKLKKDPWKDFFKIKQSLNIKKVLDK